MPTLLRVCATPDSGFWTIDNDANPLWDKVTENNGNYSVPCNRIGFNPDEPWADEEASDYPITGFAAELLLDVMDAMGSNWDCVVDFLPTYTAALYATTKQKVCDVVYVPLTVSATRAFCGESPPLSTVSNVPACPPYDASVTWATANASQACCADFTFNMMATSLAGIVSSADNNLVLESGLDEDLILELINILSIFGVGVIFFGHLLWFVEKTHPATTPFARAYLEGSLDAIWAVAQGFMQLHSPCGRMIGMVIIFARMTVFAILAGTIASVLTSASLQKIGVKWSVLQDIDRSTVVCCPAPSYHTYTVLEFATTYYPEDNSLATCLEDLQAGKAQVVAYDEPQLQNVLALNATLAGLYEVIPGTDEIVFASAFSGEYISVARDDFEQAIIVSSTRAEELSAEFFPSSVEVDSSSSSTDTDESTSTDGDEELDVATAVSWVPLAICALYAIAAFTAHMWVNTLNKQKCILVRLGNVCKNQVREVQLHRTLSMAAKTGLDDIASDIAKDVFILLDTDGSHTIPERKLQVLANKLKEHHTNGGLQVAPRDVRQIKALLLHIFNNNVDGLISPLDFSAAFSETMTSVSAQEMLRDLAWEARYADGDGAGGADGRGKAAVATTVGTKLCDQGARGKGLADLDVAKDEVDVENSAGPLKLTPLNEVTFPARSRRSATMLPPLEVELAQELAQMFEAANIEAKRDRLEAADLADIIDQFGRRHSFSSKGIEKMTMVFLEIFDKHDDNEAAIEEFTRLYHTYVTSPRRYKSFSLPPRRVPNAHTTGRTRSPDAPPASHATIRAKMQELTRLLQAFDDPENKTAAKLPAPGAASVTVMAGAPVEEDVTPGTDCRRRPMGV